jgi:hypothetical protein
MTAIDWGDPLNTGLPNFLRREESPAPTAADSAPPIDAVLALILLRHLGVNVVEHRDGTSSGAFKDCGTVIPSFRCKVEKTTPLELLRHCWEGDSRRVDGLSEKQLNDVSEEHSEKDETELRRWFSEQYTLMDAARFAKAGEAVSELAAAPEPSTEAASAKPATQQVARPLTDLVRLIKKQLRLGEEAAAPHWLEVGKLLHEAKAQLAHGLFGDWCKEHFGISATQRARYMKAAESAVQNFRAGKYEDASLEDHLRGTSYETKPRAQQSAINSEALREDALNRAEERDLRRKLMLKLIDRGYKSLAAELHPDKGGSTEAMTRLNKARDAMKRCTTSVIGMF